MINDSSFIVFKDVQYGNTFAKEVYLASVHQGWAACVVVKALA